MPLALVGIGRRDPQDLASGFVAGEILEHPNGTTVRFEDHRWIIRPGRGKNQSVTFAGLPEWMFPYAKLLIAEAWISRGLSSSSITGYIAALRNADRALEGFRGPIKSLTSEHVERLRRWIFDQWSSRERAFARLATELGRPPSSKEVRSLSRRSDSGLTAGTLSAVPSVLNKLLKVADLEGVIVNCSFTCPKLLEDSRRSVGSAAAAKVLSTDQLAMLLEAALADIEEYRDLRSDVDAEVARYLAVAKPEFVLEHDDSIGKPARRLQSYFGLGGREMMSAKQLARTEGVAAAGFTRTLRRYLVRAVGEGDAHWLMEQRRIASGAVPRFSHAEREAARKRCRDYFERHPLDLGDLLPIPLSEVVELTKKVFGIGVPIHSMKEAGAASEGMLWARLRPLAMRVHGKAYRTHADALWEKRTRLPILLDRAVKACALLLQIVSYRRISALLESVTVDTAGKWVDAPNGDRVFELDFHAGKMWGPRGLPERVPIPGYFGEVAEYALTTAREITASYRSYASESEQAFLFLTSGPGQAWLNPTPLRAASLNSYLNSSRDRDEGGLVKRRAVEGCTHVTLHLFRHTAATNMITAGGSAVAVADVMGNSADMATRFYFSQGSEEQREQAVELARGNLTSGFLLDALRRVAQNPPEVGDGHSAQLSYEDAMRRILDMPEFIQDYLGEDGGFGPDEARSLLAGGLTVNITSFGGCIYPVEEGPCPAVHKCPIGCDPERAASDPECGCRWQVKLPHDAAIRAYEDDLEVLKSERNEYGSRPEYAAASNHLETQIRIYEAQLESLIALRPDGGASGKPIAG